MRKILFFYLMLSSINILLAQDSSTSSKMLDSLLSTKTNPGYEVLIKKLDEIKAQSILDRDTIIRARCLLYQSSFYSRLSDYVNLSKTIVECNRIAQDTSIVPVSIYLSSLNNTAELEKLKGNHKKANELHLKVLELEKSYRNRPKNLSRYYHNLTLNYNTIGDFKSALSSIKQAIKYAKKADSFQKDYAESILLKGLVHKNLKQYDLAIKEIKYGLDILGTPSKENELRFKLHINGNQELVEIHYNNKQFSQSKNALLKVKLLQQELKHRRYKTAEISSLISIREQDPQNAIIHLKKAIEEILDKYNTNRDSPVLPRLYKKLGDAFVILNNLDSSLVYYQTGLQYFDNKLNRYFRNNPDVSKIKATTQALELLHAKAKVANSIYESSLNEEDFENGLSAYKSVVQLIDKMKNDFLIESSQFFVAEQALPIYQEAIEILVKRIKISNDERLLEDLFVIIGKNKSSILFQSVKRKYDLLSSALPKEILEKEANLSSQISFYSKLISEEKLKSKQDSFKLTNLENALFEANEKYILYKQHLKNDFEAFYNFNDELSDNLSIKDVQQKLNHKEATIEYFIGKSEIYNLTILKDKIYFHSIPIMEIENDIKEYKSLLSHKPVNSDDQQNLIDISKRLGSKLIQPSIFKEVEGIIIIPDGLLGQIPFESLINSNSNTYFIENYSISYCYSINQYLESKKSELSKNQILCLAPQFQTIIKDTRACDGTQLGKLNFTKEEAQFIAKNFKSKVFLSENTKTSDLIDNIKNYSIIHLATHACLNSVDPMLSELHFNNGALTNYDIQDLNVRPELVVLSACNTAQGQIKMGEGLISLTRGFFEAGIKSLQSSLWSIDDYASAQIIKSMYANLKEGNKKSVALQKAKTTYLLSADKLRKHPYYWAGIVHIGNDSPLVFSSPNKWKWILASLSVAIFVFLFLKYKK